jgi:hypothetical protein
MRGKNAYKTEITPKMTLLDFFIWLTEPVSIYKKPMGKFVIYPSSPIPC